MAGRLVGGIRRRSTVSLRSALRLARVPCGVCRTTACSRRWYFPPSSRTRRVPWHSPGVASRPLASRGPRRLILGWPFGRRSQRRPALHRPSLFGRSRASPRPDRPDDRPGRAIFYDFPQDHQATLQGGLSPGDTARQASRSASLTATNRPCSSSPAIPTPRSIPAIQRASRSASPTTAGDVAVRIFAGAGHIATHHFFGRRAAREEAANSGSDAGFHRQAIRGVAPGHCPAPRLKTRAAADLP